MNKLLIGFTTGLILGILYAPAKGTKTRHKLSRAGGTIKDGWDTLADAVANTFDRAEEELYYDEGAVASTDPNMD